MFRLFRRSSPAVVEKASDAQIAVVQPPLGLNRPRLRPHEVFRAGGTPKFTLVDRSHTDAFNKIEFSLQKTGKIISLFGESKSGKTTLCLEVLKDRSPIEIHGSDAKSVGVFWDTVRQKLNLPSTIHLREDHVDEEKNSQSHSWSLEGNAFVGKAGAGQKGKEERKYSHESGQTREFQLGGKSAMIDGLIAAGGVLVIDDFHWIPQDVQIDVLRELRPFLNKNGSIVVISVPERAEELLRQDLEMAKLCTLVEAPGWELDEIIAIGRKGFKALNLNVDERILRRLAGASHGNPMLMQENCYQLCAHAKIKEAGVELTTINLGTEDLRAILRETAGQHGPLFRRFAYSSSPETWVTARGSLVNIYSLLLLGMRHITFKQEIGKDKLTERVAELIGPKGKKPDRGTVTRALLQLSGEMKRELGDNAPIEYDQRTGRVYFLDPFFMAYIQWVFAPSMGEPYPDEK